MFGRAKFPLVRGHKNDTQAGRRLGNVQWAKARRFLAKKHPENLARYKLQVIGSAVGLH